MTPLRISPGVTPALDAAWRTDVAVVLRFIAQVRLTGDASAAERLMAPVVPAHQVTRGGTVVRTPAEYAEHARDLLKDAVHASYDVTELLADRDRVYVRWLVTTQHGAEAGSAVYRVQDGRIAEYWIQLPE